METQPNKLFFKHILHKVFLEDWVMKLVALAITLALWFGVTGLSSPTTQRLTSIPLSLRFSNNIEVTNAPPEEVDLVVTGDRRKLAQINKNDIVISVDISDLTPGDRVINLLPENVAVSLPTGVKLDAIQPRTIPVRIEAVEERDVEVRAETSGALPEGYEIYSQTVTPQKVRLRGPAGFVRSLEFVPTERIDLTNRKSDFTARQVPIGVANPKASILTETVVDVSFLVGEQRVERVYSVAVNDDTGRRAIVTLFGPRSLFENVRPADLRVDILPDPGRDATQVVLPPSLEGRVEVRSVRLR